VTPYIVKGECIELVGEIRNRASKAQNKIVVVLVLVLVLVIDLTQTNETKP